MNAKEAQNRPRAPRPMPAHSPLAHLRAGALLLGATLLLGSVGYPLLVVGFAELVTPGTANGSLVTGPNGTVVGSSLVGQNLSLPFLFWERPSAVDFQMALGTPSPLGPTQLGLKQEILGYLSQYLNYSLNGSNYSLPGLISLWLVSDPASGIDPDIPTADALAQIPRISLAGHLPVATLTSLVDQYTQEPPGGVLGPSYVNVLELDIALEKRMGI